LPEKLKEEFARRTARRMHVELDESHGCCLFRDADARRVLADALDHFHGERWWLGDYVIMPNHVHLLAQPIQRINGAEHRSTVARSSGPCCSGGENGAEHRSTVARSSGPCCSGGENGAEHRSTELEDILGSVKGFVSTRLTKLGRKGGQLWQQENYDRLVRDREELNIWRTYIRENPVKAKLRTGEFVIHECDWF
jgi:type I restriction enzyme R subunit